MAVPKGHKFINRKRPTPFTKTHLENMSKGLIGKNIGKIRREESKDKMRNDKNYNWRGEDVSYSGIHKWVVRHKGRPEMCEKCGKTGLTGGKINWANIDHQYRRVLDDYIRLCARCHSIYDRSNNLYKRTKK